MSVSEQISPLHPPTMHPFLALVGLLVGLRFVVGEGKFVLGLGLMPVVGVGVILYDFWKLFIFTLMAKAKSTIKRQIREGMSSFSLVFKVFFALG